MSGINHIVRLADLSSENIQSILDEAIRFKKNRAEICSKKPLSGKSVGMIFQKRSTRTRVSTEVATFELGGHALFLGPSDIQLGANETILDTARVLGRMVNCVAARVFAQEDVEILANESGVPTVNLMSDLWHPMQLLADMMTMQERFNKLKDLKVGWVGDSSNVANSFLVSAAKMGFEMTIATAPGYEPNQEILQLVDDAVQDELITITNDRERAARNADVLVTDTFVSMGQEEAAKKRLLDLRSYNIDQELMSLANPEAIFMHCLPRHKEEVTDEVFYGPQSVVWDEAENRLHTIAAVLLHLLS